MSEVLDERRASSPAGGAVELGDDLLYTTHTQPPERGAPPCDQPTVLVLISTAGVTFSPIGTTESEVDACAPLLTVARRHLAALARELRQREPAA